MQSEHLVYIVENNNRTQDRADQRSGTRANQKWPELERSGIFFAVQRILWVKTSIGGV